MIRERLSERNDIDYTLDKEKKNPCNPCVQNYTYQTEEVPRKIAICSEYRRRNHNIREVNSIFKGNRVSSYQKGINAV